MGLLRICCGSVVGPGGSLGATGGPRDDPGCWPSWLAVLRNCPPPVLGGLRGRVAWEPCWFTVTRRGRRPLYVYHPSSGCWVGSVRGNFCGVPRASCCLPPHGLPVCKSEVGYPWRSCFDLTAFAARSPTPCQLSRPAPLCSEASASPRKTCLFISYKYTA